METVSSQLADVFFFVGLLYLFVGIGLAAAFCFSHVFDDSKEIEQLLDQVQVTHSNPMAIVVLLLLVAWPRIFFGNRGGPRLK